MGPESLEELLGLSTKLAYPAGTCQHLQWPNFGDLRSPLLSKIRETASSCLLCLVVSTVVGKMLPHLAAAGDATVRLDILETLGRGNVCIAAHAGPTGTKDFKEERLEMYSHAPTPLSLIPVQPRTPQRTDSDQAISQIKAWMAECVGHPSCPTKSSVMPRRVLKISQGGRKVQLHLTKKGEAAPYLTLSHCWGSTPPLQTIKANIGSHLHNIPLRTLPPLFLDAIALTARLGYQYLWIDSLCIIQDSPHDWDRESSLMGAIYTHSALTIAASQAPSSSSSLFSSQSSTPIEVASFTVHARLTTKHLPRHPDPATFPLLTRSWVYQERLLSRRVVHFGPDELAWECHDGIQCQCGYFDRADQRFLVLHDDRRGMNTKARHTAALLRAAIMAKKPHQEAPSPSPSQTPETAPSPLPAHWRKMVTEYSPLALSRASDRLPALSGLAKQMRPFRRGGARYLAGLWEDTFFRDGLWVAVANPGERNANAEWLAPTWSWASQRGAVRYTGGERMQMGGLGVYRPAEMGNAGDVTSELVGGSCELVAAECVPLGLDDTGRVEKGWVKVRGWVVEMDPVGEFLRVEEGEEEEGRWVVRINGVESRRVYWDEAPKGVEEGGEFWGQRLCLLRIGCIPATGEREPYDEWSLLLRQAGEGVFERCGIVNRSKQFRSYDSSKPEDVHDYHEHRRETSPWFGKVKEAVVITIV